MNTNWDIDPCLLEQIETRLPKVANKLDLDIDDLRQETLIWVATHPDWAKRPRRNPWFPIGKAGERLARHERRHRHETLQEEA